LGPLPVRLSLGLWNTISHLGPHRWNAALALATFLDENRSLYQNKRVLELGAGGALPSIVAAKNGAAKVRRIASWLKPFSFLNDDLGCYYRLSRRGAGGEYTTQRH